MKTIIVDLDGTLALNEHRYHHIDTSNGKKPDWDKFFLACIDDMPNNPVIEAVKSFKKSGFKIHIFSARGKIAYRQTLDWLKKYSVPYDDITLRDIGDYTPDEHLKAAWLQSYYPDYHEKVIFVLDDRQKVVDMWRSFGLTCFQVAKGDF